jgi:hypothetical protein
VAKEQARKNRASKNRAGKNRASENRAGEGESGNQVEERAPKRARVAIGAPRYSGRYI